MSGLQNSGSAAPYPGGSLEALVRRVQDLERTVAAMSTQLVNQGTLQVNDPNSGNRVFFVGEDGMLDGSDRMQAVVYINRQDGSDALAMFDGGTTPGHTIEQALQWYDRQGNVIFADDTNGGVGIAEPQIPVGTFVDIATTSLAATNSASYVDLQWCAARRQHPRMIAQVLVYSSSSGTTGNVQIVDGSGNVIGSPVAVTSLEFTEVTIGPAAWPLGTWSWEEGLSLLKLQAERTAGTGVIGARVLGIWGQAS